VCVCVCARARKCAPVCAQVSSSSDCFDLQRAEMVCVLPCQHFASMFPSRQLAIGISPGAKHTRRPPPPQTHTPPARTACAARGSICGAPPDNRVLLRHLAGPQRQARRHHRREALGDGRDRQRHSDLGRSRSGKQQQYRARQWLTTGAGSNTACGGLDVGQARRSCCKVLITRSGASIHSASPQADRVLDSGSHHGSQITGQSKLYDQSP
jgi:hypothetical protein